MMKREQRRQFFTPGGLELLMPAKPRIRMVSRPTPACRWACGGAHGGAVGFGATPAAAYSDWQRWQ